MAAQDLDDSAIMQMSPNLRAALGFGAASTAEPGPGGDREKEWKPPTFSGLHNSSPLKTLMPLAVGKEKGLEVMYKNREGTGAADGGQGSDGDEEGMWDSDEDGWDYEGMVYGGVIHTRSMCV